MYTLSNSHDPYETWAFDLPLIRTFIKPPKTTNFTSDAFSIDFSKPFSDDKINRTTGTISITDLLNYLKSKAIQDYYFKTFAIAFEYPDNIDINTQDVLPVLISKFHNLTYGYSLNGFFEGPYRELNLAKFINNPDIVSKCNKYFDEHYIIEALYTAQDLIDLRDKQYIKPNHIQDNIKEKEEYFPAIDFRLKDNCTKLKRAIDKLQPDTYLAKLFNSLKTDNDSILIRKFQSVFSYHLVLTQLYTKNTTYGNKNTPYFDLNDIYNTICQNFIKIKKENTKENLANYRKRVTNFMKHLCSLYHTFNYDSSDNNPTNRLLFDYKKELSFHMELFDNVITKNRNLLENKDLCEIIFRLPNAFSRYDLINELNTLGVDLNATLLYCGEFMLPLLESAFFIYIFIFCNYSLEAMCKLLSNYLEKSDFTKRYRMPVSSPGELQNKLRSADKDHLGEIIISTFEYPAPYQIPRFCDLPYTADLDISARVDQEMIAYYYVKSILN